MASLPRTYTFPPLEAASPEGLLAVGGDLNPDRLLSAYRQGVFPWFSDGQPILWWSPNPRAILYPADLHISRSLRKSLRTQGFEVTADRAFDDVIQRCAESRNAREGTWITSGMQEAYCTLHRMGYAHSVETWRNGQLVGGLYGLAIGKAFFGESMFSQITDASKTALVALSVSLTAGGYHFIDCQVVSEHLNSLGAKAVPRYRFSSELKQAVETPVNETPWNWTIAARELS
ncbi:MAG: leucyl/phenylalanyl-tRNA--protein transferase [Proteobacteria bacterium TMED61]|nr:MAG: leucyl/phenylalanyl-tRNA--protein transferase [Proteobacteria bacterium TMED61]